MKSNLLVMENGHYEGFDTKEDLVKSLLGNDYYEISNKDKLERIRFKVMANSINFEVLSSEVDEIKDENYYIYWLIKHNCFYLLERKNSNYFTSFINKENIKDDYIIVNKFIDEIIENR